MTRAGFRRFCRVGLVVHGVFVLCVGIGAYVGGLPHVLAEIPHADFALHVLLIGMCAFFLDGALAYRPLAPGFAPWLRLAPVLVLGVAGIDEYCQRFSPRRTSDWFDFAADVIGVGILSYASHRIHEGRRLDGASGPG